MNIVINIHHPAHVHKFKHLINLLSEKHKLYIVVVEKEITCYLLDYYNINYKLLGENKKGILNKLINLFLLEIKLFFRLLKFKPDIFIGGGEALTAHVSFLYRKPYIAFDDSDNNKLGLLSYIPFADHIVTPSCFLKDFGKKHIRYESFHELAYLHPKYFKADEEVLKEFGIKNGERFFVIRKISSDAIEDRGQQNLDYITLKQIVDLLNKYGKVLISAEQKIDKYFNKHLIKANAEHIHSLLYYADIFVGDSLTMFTEAAVLGTPAVCISSESYIAGNFNDICDKYQLGYRYDNYNAAVTKIKNLVVSNDLKEQWSKKRNNYLNDMIDPTAFWAEFIESYHTNYLK